MAMAPDRDNPDLERQRTRIRRALDEVGISGGARKPVADADEVGAEAGVLPLSTVFQGVIAVAARPGAGAAIAKFSLP